MQTVRVGPTTVPQDLADKVEEYRKAHAPCSVSRVIHLALRAFLEDSPGDQAA